MTTTIVTLPPREAYQVQCHRCGHVWLYTGKNRHYAQCSHCRTTVTLYLNNDGGTFAMTADTTTLERDYTEYE
jgi:uncharacterized protein (DUF983 family)